ncbi:SDR family oxidoreductase [Parasphingorhabdus flavimaris]|uniref:SDR family NAD(P)-dependent oxidoreductase n=1 Tax=Parasphingorhabdus flavimaris TaxID=266812 RepID=UPI003001BD54
MIFREDLFANKTILVTGASSGIGREFCILASKLGAKLRLLGRDKARLASVEKKLAGSGHITFVDDISGVDNFRALLIRIAKEGGPFNGLFHAAGLNQFDSLKRGSDANIHKNFDASFGGSVAILAACARKDVMPQHSSIVLMSSVAGHSGQKGMSLYCASKSAIDGLVRGAAVELADRGITVNSIVSGAVDTEMHRMALSWMNEAAIKEYEKKHLLGFGDPEDIAHSAVYLLSPAGKWITGTNMVVDGGLLAQ